MPDRSSSQPDNPFESPSSSGKHASATGSQQPGNAKAWMHHAGLLSIGGAAVYYGIVNLVSYASAIPETSYTRMNMAAVWSLAVAGALPLQRHFHHFRAALWSLIGSLATIIIAAVLVTAICDATGFATSRMNRELTSESVAWRAGFALIVYLTIWIPVVLLVMRKFRTLGQAQAKTNRRPKSRLND